jgi:hypothetical protein
VHGWNGHLTMRCGATGERGFTTFVRPAF